MQYVKRGFWPAVMRSVVVSILVIKAVRKSGPHISPCAGYQKFGYSTTLTTIGRPPLALRLWYNQLKTGSTALVGLKIPPVLVYIIRNLFAWERSKWK